MFSALNQYSPAWVQVADSKCENIHSFEGPTLVQALSDAAKLTQKRLDEIQKVKDEIEALIELQSGRCVSTVYILERVIKREQAALIELQRGMKGLTK